MIERGLGHYYHPETNTEWIVVEWKPGNYIKNTDEFRLTAGQLARSTLTTFAIRDANGNVEHRTFSGALPHDLEDLVDYWTDHESI